MMFINLEIAILNINGVDYCCNINEISKSDAVNLLYHGERSIIKIKKIKDIFFHIQNGQQNYNFN